MLDLLMEFEMKAQNLRVKTLDNLRRARKKLEADLQELVSWALFDSVLQKNTLIHAEHGKDAGKIIA